MADGVVPDQRRAGDRGADQVADRADRIATPIEATADDDAPTSLAPITRPRCGTSVNVVSPLRWLHSLVTDRIAIIGRITDIGKPMAAAKVS